VWPEIEEIKEKSRHQIFADGGDQKEARGKLDLRRREYPNLS
jgi:hypothetical protein